MDEARASTHRTGPMDTESIRARRQHRRRCHTSQAGSWLAAPSSRQQGRSCLNGKRGTPARLCHSGSCRWDTLRTGPCASCWQRSRRRTPWRSSSRVGRSAPLGSQCTPPRCPGRCAQSMCPSGTAVVRSRPRRSMSQTRMQGTPSHSAAAAASPPGTPSTSPSQSRWRTCQERTPLQRVHRRRSSGRVDTRSNRARHPHRSGSRTYQAGTSEPASGWRLPGRSRLRHKACRKSPSTRPGMCQLGRWCSVLTQPMGRGCQGCKQLARPLLCCMQSQARTWCTRRCWPTPCCLSTCRRCTAAPLQRLACSSDPPRRPCTKSRRCRPGTCRADRPCTLRCRPC